MKPTEVLKEEHRAIELALKILEKICDRLENGEKVDVEHLEKILEFIRIFVDKCHHGKEEDLLFPAMEEAGIHKEGGPIGVMLSEHNIGRDYVKKFCEVLREYSKGEPGAINKITENARGYTQLLKEHIYKEDNILYPMADAHLTEERQKELVDGFEKVEEERIGKGKHEEFHKLLHHFEEIYLR